jgi:hypothetical protein
MSSNQFSILTVKELLLVAAKANLALPTGIRRRKEAIVEYLSGSGIEEVRSEVEQILSQKSISITKSDRTIHGNTFY